MNRVTGLLYLFVIVAAGTTPVQILPRIDDIADAEGLLHLAVASDLVVLLCEVALTGLFYLLFRPVDRTLALLMMLFRLAFTGMLVTNVSNLVAPTPLSLEAYDDGYTIALLFFGAHVALLGCLLYRSGRKVLGGWLTLGSLCYFGYGFGNLAVPGVEVPLLVVAPVAIAEVALGLLLLLGRVPSTPAWDPVASTATTSPQPASRG
jgi:hypothetical protein